MEKPHRFYKIIYPDNNGMPCMIEDTTHKDKNMLFYCAGDVNAVINRLTAAAENLLKKHRLGAVTEADERWMETELESVEGI